MYNPQLDAFVQVADCGSFNKAAEALYLSSTAVIKQINALEKHLDLQLVFRTNHGITLTEAGKVLYKHAKGIMDYSQRAIQEARVTEGRVSIPASTLAALDHPIAVRAVKLLLAKVEYYQISSVHLDQILALAASTSPSASHNLPGDLFVWR